MILPHFEERPGGEHQEITVLVHVTKAEDMRRAIKAAKQKYTLLSEEKPAGSGEILFKIVSDDPIAFFHIGKNFGIALEFKK